MSKIENQKSSETTRNVSIRASNGALVEIEPRREKGKRKGEWGGRRRKCPLKWSYEKSSTRTFSPFEGGKRHFQCGSSIGRSVEESQEQNEAW